MKQDSGEKMYSIGEVADKLDIKESTLRYWEEVFQVLSPQKSESGRRIYSEDDIKILQIINKLRYEEKLSIEGTKRRIREILNNNILYSNKEYEDRYIKYQENLSLDFPDLKNDKTPMSNPKLDSHLKSEIIKSLKEILDDLD